MSLADRYREKELRFFIELLENPDDYAPEALDAAKEELDRRGISGEEVKQEALVRIREICEKIVANFSPINDTLTAPPSNLVPRGEVVDILKAEFMERVNRMNDMKPDSWQYVIGAIA